MVVRITSYYIRVRIGLGLQLAFHVISGETMLQLGEGRTGFVLHSICLVIIKGTVGPRYALCSSNYHLQFSVMLWAHLLTADVERL